MPRGRQVRTLRKDQIERLERFRRAPHEGAPSGYSYPQLRLAMGKPCGWSVLQKALKGEPIWELIYWRVSEWIERYVPATKTHDGKAAAAGRDSDDTELSEQPGAGRRESEDPAGEIQHGTTRRGSD